MIFKTRGFSKSYNFRMGFVSNLIVCRIWKMLLSHQSRIACLDLHVSFTFRTHNFRKRIASSSHCSHTACSGRLLSIILTVVNWCGHPAQRYLVVTLYQRPPTKRASPHIAFLVACKSAAATTRGKHWRSGGRSTDVHTNQRLGCLPALGIQWFRSAVWWHLNGSALC